jgi:hypothetical protein
VKQPSLSVKPDIHASPIVGNLQIFLYIIIDSLFLINFSFNLEINIENFTLLVGNTILPLNIKHNK